MSRSEESKVPRVRFSDYVEDWKEKTVGAILSEVKRSIVLEDNKEYELITVKRRNEGIVSRGHLLGRNILVKNYSQLKTGDFVISKRQVVHGATGIVPIHLNDAIVSNEYLVATDSNDISTEFLTILSSLPEMRRKFFLSSYGVDIEKLFFDVADWKKQTLTIPDKTEQEKISLYFKEMDQLIQLIQHKYVKLLTLKQAMLQKMFPRDGTTTPEIRFREFKGKWTEQQMKSIVEVCSGRDYKHLHPGNIPVFGTGGYMLSVDKALSYDKDAIGIGRKGTIDKPYLLRCPFWTVDTLFYAYPKKDHNLDFVHSIFQKIDWKKYDESTGVPSLSKTAINEIYTYVPGPEEQKKIGLYFSRVDDLISRQATQLEKLKQVKAACLRAMFV
ncbi:restriction endonuclease subunit S [Pseudomonas putida]|nr:restriction endonuclease subunit S [Pseudomonas putida]